jgi:hypothetical protein
MVRALRVGVPGGMAGGALMALWSMVAMWLTGLGFWTPLNLIAHTFYKSAPLNGTFSALALLVGLAVHMTVASVFGVVITLLALWLPGRRSVVIAAGILFVAVVWPVMQWGVWYKLDEDAAEGFTGWIFAFAHLVFAVTAAGIASIGVADDESARRGRHAAGRTPPQLTPPSGSLFQPTGRQQHPLGRPRQQYPLNAPRPQYPLSGPRQQCPPSESQQGSLPYRHRPPAG